MIDLKAYARPQESEGECLLCGAPLTYLVRGEMMECAFCHKKETSKTRCMKGHYVCNECHARGVDSLLPLCLSHTSSNPVALLETLMDAPFCHMHGPEHHVLVGASLLTAYANAGGTLDLKNALLEMLRRGGQIPGGACGFWGACGAAVSHGFLGGCQPDDSQSPCGHRRHRRSAMLQARFLSRHPRNRALHRRKDGRAHGAWQDRLQALGAEQPVHRQALSLFQRRQTLTHRRRPRAPRVEVADGRMRLAGFIFSGIVRHFSGKPALPPAQR